VIINGSNLDDMAGDFNMKFRSDYLDYACDGMLGHKNWAYENTLISLEELKKNDEVECVVVFFKNPSEEEDTDE
tara:strand:+ start:44 stop:265 length:222 start_codon:yes stop_codon:yes gene_type:complete